MEESLKKTMKTVYTVIERGEGKAFWVRIGVGFTNKDGSLTLRLDALPVNGSLQVREWESGDRRYDGERRYESDDGHSRVRLPPREKPTDSVV